VVEISIRIRLTSRAEQPFAFAAAHVGNVFGEVGDALLGLEFVGGSGEYLEVGFETAGGGAVGEDYVGEAGGEYSGGYGGVEGEEGVVVDHGDGGGEGGEEVEGGYVGAYGGVRVES